MVPDTVRSASKRNTDPLRTEHLHADLGRRTARGGVTAIAAQIARIVVQLTSLAILARLLAPSDFGLVAMATTLTGFVGIFTSLGLSEATVQREEIDQATVSALFHINVAMGLVLMLVCAVASPLVGWFFGDPRVVMVTVALSLSIPLAAAGTQHAALLQRGMRWGPLQWTPIIAQVSGGILALLLAWQTGVGYWALVVQPWTVALVSTVLFWWFCPWRPNLVPRFRNASPALHFGLNLTGFYFVNYLHRQFDNVLVGWRWGAMDLGYYTRAYQLLTLPLGIISAPVASAVIPALSRLQDDPARWRETFLIAYGFVNLMAAGLTAIMIVSANPLVRVFYGPGWEPVGPIFQMLSLSMFASTAMAAMGWVYISLGRTDRMLKWSLMLAPVLLISFGIGLPFGPAGLALSYSLGMCAMAGPCIVYALRISPVSAWEAIRIAVGSALVGIAAAIGGRLVVGFLNPSGPLATLISTTISVGLVFLPLAAICINFAKAFRPIRNHITEIRRQSPFLQDAG